MVSEIVVVDGKVLHLGLAKGQLAENVFLVGDPARALSVAKRFDDIRCEVRNREYVTITGSYEGLPVSVIGTGIGVDNVDLPAATARGIVVVNTPGGNNITTAEHAVALLVSLARHVPQADAAMKAGRWEKKRFMGAWIAKSPTRKFLNR